MAIDDLLDEHEQGERVRSWLRQNGGGLIGGIALGLAAIAGWQWWGNHQRSGRMQANVEYQSVANAVAAGHDDRAAQLAARLAGNAPYGALAALAVAKADVTAGHADKAVQALDKAGHDDPLLDAVVAQRRARLLLDAGKPAEALALLKSIAGANDNASVQELVGDAELARQQSAAAQSAYQRALTLTDEGDPLRRLLELKLVAAGGQLTTPGSTAPNA
jgi:predicted negative regulator of RcsB-dependent stress response